MTLTRPKFSILLPTYNRGELLRLAIESVLRQTYEDFELIITDGGSTDNTEEVVGEFNEQRIHYFKSDIRLTMIENYDFALSKANGEYIIFFSDDDAFVPSMADRVLEAITKTDAEMIIFPFAHYFHEGDAENYVKANTLKYPEFTGNLTRVSSTDDLLKMSGRVFLSPQPADNRSARPLIGNVVLRQSVIREIRGRTVSLFATIPVDLYFITLILSVIKEYYVLDIPLLVWSQWRNNSSIDSGSDLRHHYEQLLGGQTLDFVPLKFALPVNCAANSILKASADIGQGHPTIPVDWKWYFVKMHEYLIGLDADRINTSSEMAELFQSLQSQSSSIREYFAANSSRRFRMKQRIKKAFPSVYTQLRILKEKWIHKPGTPRIFTILGSDNFQNVLESAAHLDNVIT